VYELHYPLARLGLVGRAFLYMRRDRKIAGQEAGKSTNREILTRSHPVELSVTLYSHTLARVDCRIEREMHLELLYKLLLFSAQKLLIDQCVPTDTERPSE